MRIHKNHNILFHSIILFTTAILICLSSCENIDYLKKPSVQTLKAENSTAFTVQASGEITDYGDTEMLEYGFCWSESDDPTKLDSVTKLDLNSIQDIFICTITGLQPDQTYHVRAFAINKTGTAYGNIISFTTNDGNILITTAEISDVTPSSAQGGGNITDDGGSPVTARGVCWNTSGAPTVNGNKTSDGSGTGIFTSNITSLDIATTYHVRAYAINEIGTTYGNEISFTTDNIPALTSTAITDITATSAQSGGDISSDGGSPVTARGVCWNTTGTPTTDDDHTTDGSGTGNFTSNLSGLTEWTIYYVRAYATNEAGTAYGEELTFKASSTVTDYEGNEYNTIKIGNQVWMAENLKSTCYADGTPLVDGTSAGDITGDYTTKYCFSYAGNESNADIYGKLYTWAAVMNDAASSDAIQSGVQGVCPAGWHVPSDSEWKELEMYLGMSQSEADSYGNRGTDEGGKLKETGTAHWISGSFATNESGFTALPGGSRSGDGSFSGISYSTYFWSATENSTSHSWYRKLGFDHSKIIRYANEKNNGYSVRCIRD